MGNEEEKNIGHQNDDYEKNEMINKELSYTEENKSGKESVENFQEGNDIREQAQRDDPTTTDSEKKKVGKEDIIMNTDENTLKETDEENKEEKSIGPYNDEDERNEIFDKEMSN